MSEIGFEAATSSSLIYKDTHFNERVMVNTADEAKGKLLWLLHSY
jgi:hypothetical protein